MIAPFFESLYTYYKNSASAFYTATGGRWYFQTAPKTAAKPYVACWDIGTDGADNWFSHQFEKQRFQLSIYSASADTALTLLGTQCKALFDEARFSVSGWSVISMDRHNVAQPGIIYQADTRDWCMPIVYETLLQRGR